MQICRLTIKNFRGISDASLHLPTHGVLIGDNNTGKTTVLEALDLVLGPDRLNRTPCVDEHDFFQGTYLVPQPAGIAAPLPPTLGVPTMGLTSALLSISAPKIEIEATISHLSAEQKARFSDYIEFWDTSQKNLYQQAQPAGVDVSCMSEALRVTFIGCYDPEEDDFEGRTFFTRSLTESPNPVAFSKKDKQLCGFLYLRSLRTGSRALSLERGSLLDIVLRLKDVRPQMWEATIAKLDSYSVASDPKLGLSGILESINESLKRYVPKEWGVEPHLKVSNLTREHLRKVITAFIATGDGKHAAPFFRQGTGTINMLVLAMLSQIAQDKQNVIFAMEEPETAIPPYAQKRIVHEIRKLASQTLFTSHSPYVLEEFTLEETLVLARSSFGSLQQSAITLPANVKLKRYRQEFRTRFCEGLLARRVLIAEGATEASAFPVVCRHLSELRPDIYRSLESLGICTIDAGGEGNIADLAKLYTDIGKTTFALCDQQTDRNRLLIEGQVKQLYMHSEHGFENLVLKNTSQAAMIRFAQMISWPPHLSAKYSAPGSSVLDALFEYFCGAKAEWGVADFLAQCTEDEVPLWLRETCKSLIVACDPPATQPIPPVPPPPIPPVPPPAPGVPPPPSV